MRANISSWKIFKKILKNAGLKHLEIKAFKGGLYKICERLLREREIRQQC